MGASLLPDSSTKAGTLGGTLLVVLLQINGQEVIKTIVLAALGAVVSFGVSKGLKAVVGKKVDR